MKHAWIFFCLWLVFAGFAFPQAGDGDREAIAKVIDDSIGWFKTKDFDRLAEIFPPDSDLFLFQPDSQDTVIGGRAFWKSTDLWRDPGNVYLSHKVRDLRINFSAAGTVAWWSALLDDCGSYGGREACWKDCRWTGVAEKRDGKWVIVQGHFSFARDVVEAEALAGTAGPAEEFADYPAMRQRVVDLFAQKKYAAAAVILKGGLDKFPDHQLANTFNLALSALMLQDADKAVYWLEEGHRRGLFFSKWAFLGDLWKPLAGHARFQAMLRENETRIAAAQKQASMKLELVKPAAFNPRRRYPLFIALHGGGESLADFKPRWTSPLLRKDYVVAFVQSSQVADMKGFHWQEDAVTLKELTLAYQQIRQQVAVDPRRVYIGGFSSGGYGSMIALFAGIIPVRGFVILCPELPADPDDAQLALLAGRRIRGTLLTTELDRRLERQKAFVKRLNAGKLDVRLKVTPNIGHWYPENLPQLIDEALRRMQR